MATGLSGTTKVFVGSFIVTASSSSPLEGGFESSPEIAGHETVDERIAATVYVGQQMANISTNKTHI